MLFCSSVLLILSYSLTGMCEVARGVIWLHRKLEGGIELKDGAKEDGCCCCSWMGMVTRREIRMSTKYREESYYVFSFLVALQRTS